MMTPEGAPAQTAPGTEVQQPDQGGGLAEGIKSLYDGTKALLDGLTQAGAPKEIVALAQQAAQAIDGIMQAMGGEKPDQAEDQTSPEQPSGQEMSQS